MSESGAPAGKAHVAVVGQRAALLCWRRAALRKESSMFAGKARWACVVGVGMQLVGGTAAAQRSQSRGFVPELGSCELALAGLGQRALLLSLFVLCCPATREAGA